LQDQPFRPERLTDYELGHKADVLSGTLSLNGDVFYGHYDEMQRLLARLNPDGTPVTLVTNAGRARISGAEFEALWRLTPSSWPTENPHRDRTDRIRRMCGPRRPRALQ
jgi:outer membrane receptor protein involved in Fe transport